MKNGFQRVSNLRNANSNSTETWPGWKWLVMHGGGKDVRRWASSYTPV